MPMLAAGCRCCCAAWLSSRSGKLVNLALLVCVFFALAACCVSFAGDLFRARVSTTAGAAEWRFDQSGVQTEANRIFYSNEAFCTWTFCAQCDAGGKAYLACMILAFVLLLPLTATLVVRILGGVSISALARPARSIAFESAMATAAGALYLAAVLVFGATCYRSVQATPRFTVGMTGFACTIVGFFLLFVAGLLYSALRRDTAGTWHLGWTQPVGAAGWRGMNEDLLADDARYVDRVETSVGYDDAEETARPPTHAHAHATAAGLARTPAQHSVRYASTYQQSTGAPPVAAVQTQRTRTQP
jgi:hypothetical protein